MLNSLTSIQPTAPVPPERDWSEAVLALAAMAVPLVAFRGGTSLFLQGARSRWVELLGSAKTAVRSSTYWKRCLRVGAVSGAMRLGYDSIDMRLRDKEMAGSEVAFNVVSAFFWGGICATLVPRFPQVDYGVVSPVQFRPRAAKALTHAVPYHFVGLDLLGDFSKKYLTDIRERLGDPAGLTLSCGLLVFENVLATCALVPFIGSWRKAINRTLLTTFLTFFFEGVAQIQNGREWTRIDTGRLVGTNAWAHSSFLLMESVLGGLILQGGARMVGATTAELMSKQLLFVGPSLANFDIRINEKNRINLFVGYLFRYGIIMLPARILQARLGPTHPAGILFDFGFALFGMAVTNEPWPVYEGVTAIWEEELLDEIRKTQLLKRGETSFEKNQYQELTDFLSRKMGSFEFVGLRYMPSELNLAQVVALLKNSRHRIERDIFAAYLRELQLRGMTRTSQESRIWRVCGEALLGR